MPVSQKLASFAAPLTYESLPAEVADYARLCWLDQVGVIALASQDNSPSTRVRDFILTQGGVEEATIMGAKKRVPTITAAWANATLSVGSGLDGYHQASATHLLGVIIPACMAAAEYCKSSGKDFVASLVAGSEVMVRVSMGLGSDYLLSRGFHPSSIAGPFGAAVSVGKLLGLNEEQIIHALGLSGVQASGLTVWGAEKEVCTYPLQVGKACQSGVLSALLAARGYTSCEPVFEHNRGIAASHAPDADLSKITQGLGRNYEIMNTTLNLYNAGILIYTALDALLMIMTENPEVTADTIDRVSVGLPTNAMPLVGNQPYPESSTKAHLSTRFLMALTPLLGNKMLDGIDPGVDKFRLDPVIQARFEKTEVHAATELDSIFPKFMPAIVEVTTRGGKTFKKRFDGPTKGHPPNRLTADDVESKFIRIAGEFYGKKRAAALIESSRNVAKLDNVAPLIADLCRID